VAALIPSVVSTFRLAHQAPRLKQSALHEAPHLRESCVFHLGGSMKLFSILMLLSTSALASEAPYTDFTGIWDGQCMTATGLRAARAIVIMDSDKSIEIDRTSYSLPDVRKETTQVSCGDPMDNRDTYCDVEHHYDYNWNGNKTEITLSHEWGTFSASPEYISYTHTHLRLVGSALEVTYQDKYSTNGSTEICTYPKRR